MLSSASPSKIPVPFANSGTKNAIPTASQISVTPGAASLTDGFPPLTFTPLAAGGVAPFGADFNGILNRITAIQQWQTSGGLFAYDAAQSAATGGYPKGALLVRADGTGYWQNLVENNTTNPDAGGAGWGKYNTGSLINIQTFFSSGTYTPTAGATKALALLCGGGGGGAAGAITGVGQISVGSGGGGSSFAIAWLTTLVAGSVLIGAGGAGGTSLSTNAASAGAVGGQTSFATINCPGGAAGQSAGPANPPFNSQGTSQGSVATGPSSGGILLLNIAGAPGGIASAIATNAINAGNGGPGPFGGGGNASTVGGSGANSTAYGGGGGGAANPASSTGGSGGSGGPGFVLVFEYA